MRVKNRSARLMTTSERPAWREKDSNPAKLVKIGVFGVIVVSLIYPFLAVLATSLASEPDVIQNGVW
jgi:putative aldouronate transport system permease protein